MSTDEILKEILDSLNALNATVAEQGDQLKAQGDQLKAMHATLAEHGDQLKAHGDQLKSLKGTVDARYDENHSDEEDEPWYPPNLPFFSQ